MSQLSNQNTVNLFKKVYGDLHNLLPQDFPLAREISFSEGYKVGDSFVEAFCLTNETGWTLIGEAQDAAMINPAIAGIVKQSSVKPSQVVMRSVLPFGFISRSAGGGEKAFYDGTKHIMANHIRSHGRLLEALRLYGRADALLGYVSYAPTGTVYRGATYSGAGDVILTKADGTTITFVDGVSAANKAILFAPGSFASGLWVGLEGAIVKEVDSTNAVVASGKLVSVNSDLGYITVDFAPVVATSTTSHRLCYDGMELQKDMIGINKIMTNTGVLFDINAAQYSLWRANNLNLGGKRFNLKAVQTGVALAVNAGALEKPLLILVNPRTFANLTTDEAAQRKYDSSYKPASANNGFEAVEYYAANGVNTIMPHRMVKEGEAYGLVKEDWIRSGSAEISFKIPGLDKEVIFPAENQTAWIVNSYSDQYILCRAPAKQIYWNGINDESIAYAGA